MAQIALEIYGHHGQGNLHQAGELLALYSTQYTEHSRMSSNLLLKIIPFSALNTLNNPCSDCVIVTKCSRQMFDS